jgi:hypothetical protein
VYESSRPGSFRFKKGRRPLETENSDRDEERAQLRELYVAQRLKHEFRHVGGDSALFDLTQFIDDQRTQNGPDRPKWRSMLGSKHAPIDVSLIFAVLHDALLPLRSREHLDKRFGHGAADLLSCFDQTSIGIYETESAVLIAREQPSAFIACLDRQGDTAVLKSLRREQEQDLLRSRLLDGLLQSWTYGPDDRKSRARSLICDMAAGLLTQKKVYWQSRFDESTFVGECDNGTVIVASPSHMLTFETKPVVRVTRYGAFDAGLKHAKPCSVHIESINDAWSNWTQREQKRIGLFNLGTEPVAHEVIRGMISKWHDQALFLFNDGVLAVFSHDKHYQPKSVFPERFARVVVSTLQT